MLDDLPKVDFKKALSDAGVPISEEEINAEWEEINKTSDTVTNTAKYSAFWQLITAIVTTPAKWLVDYLQHQILPNLFLATATKPFLDLFAWEIDIKRSAGVKMKGLITFTRSTTTRALTIPKGTIIQSDETEGGFYQIKVANETVMEPGVSVLNVICEAVEPGLNWNLSEGYYNTLINPIDTVISVRNNSNYLIIEGQDPETDDALKLRCKNQFSAIGDFHNDSAYRRIITEVLGITTKEIYFEHGAPRGPGTVNIYLMNDIGPLAQTALDNINHHIRDNGHHGLGDDVLCHSIPTEAFDLSPTVYIDGTLTSDEQNALKLNIQSFIESAFYVHKDYFEKVTRTYPNSRFSFSNLDKELHEEFTGLKSIEFHRDDIDMTGVLKLPILGTLTVTTKTT